MVQAGSDVGLMGHESRRLMTMPVVVGEALMTGRKPRLQMVSHGVGLMRGKISYIAINMAAARAVIAEYDLICVENRCYCVFW